MLILFDFDGTIADTFELGANLINQYAQSKGYQQIDFEANRDKSARELIQMSKVKPWRIPGLLRFFRNELLTHIDKIKPFEGIIELIKNLKESKFEVGILSTNSRKVIDFFVNKYKLQNIFSYIDTDISLFGKKYALNKAKRKNKSHDYIWYIADELRDVDSAKDANVPIISVGWGYNSYESLANKNKLIVKTVDELLSLLKHI